MPSVFDIFGEINLESKAFEGSLRTVAGRLKATDAALDQTISKSNKLGDTSATVGRRYEKLGEQIQAQRNRLLDNALAFQKGEINATKFASVVTSVDRATSGLNSRLKDAKARLTELSETNLTHFQQQIQGAVNPQAAQSTDIFKRLSGFQKTQLSFQFNDILTGLASGQNPLQILAQQGGQVFQIFQMGKQAQEGVAAATTAAATAEAGFAVSAKAAAVSQGQVALSSEATAAAMTQASTASTLFGTSIIAIGATLAAGLVSILASWKLSKDILAAAEKRLKTEEAIAGALNQQYLIQSKFKERLATEAKDRSFNAFAAGDDIVGLQIARDRIQRERDAILRETLAETQLRAAVVGIRPGNQKADEKFLKAPAEAQKKQLEQQEDQISELEARIAELKKSNTLSSVDFYTGVQKRQLEMAAAAEKAEKEFAEKRKKMVEEAIKKAKEFVEHVKDAKKAVVDVFATSDNPFVRIFSDGEKAIERVRLATAGLGKELQNTLLQMVQGRTAAQAFGQSLDNSLKALSLRNEAKSFRAGALIQQSVSDRLAEQLRIVGGSPIHRDFEFSNGQIGKAILQSSVDQSQIDKRIIALTQGLDPAVLSGSQRSLAAGAREREAARLENEKVEAQKLLERQHKLLENLEKAIKSGTLIEIRNEVPGQARVTQTGGSAAVNQRYP